MTLRRAALLLAAACSGLTGCGLLAGGGTTEMQIADQAAFAGARTYRLIAPIDATPADSDSAAMRLRGVIEDNIVGTLGKKGYSRVAGDGPADLRVQYRVAAVSRVDRDAQPAPKLATLTTVGGADAATGYEPLAGSSHTASVGRLVVYVNDDKSGRVVWQGTTEAETVGAGMARGAAGRAAARLLRDIPHAAN